MSIAKQQQSSLVRCAACSTTFEPGVADPGPAGEPRCPQCGLCDSIAVTVEESTFVVRRSTRFR